MVTIWNQKKVHKKQGAGFLGCVRILASAIQRLKDSGCELLVVMVIVEVMVMVMLKSEGSSLLEKYQIFIIILAS